MQFPQADSKTKRVGVQEDLIKFRPSPNFKDMKKYLKNRTETYLEQNVPQQPLMDSNVLRQPLLEQQNVPRQPLLVPRQPLLEQNVPRQPLLEQNVPRQPLLEQNVPRQPLLEQNVPRQPSPMPQPQPPPKPDPKADVKPVVVQPPLPPYPPPPDSPPNLNIVIKKERDEEDGTLQNGERLPSPSINQNVQEIAPERPQKIKKTMCKEFIRGDCKRSVCRYSHELDLAQLPGVFTFCWNYQNTQCTYPYCKFVHATVWEEAEFYRTGILPPHARSHMKKAAPPPVSNDGVAGPSKYVAANQPPPQMYPGPSMEKPLGVISCVPACSIEQRPMPDYPSTTARNNSPKREWSELDEFSSSPRDLEPEHLAKKCKYCEFLEYRLQNHNKKVDGMIRTREEMNKKTALLNKKSNKLSLVLLTLMKPGSNLKAGGFGSGSAGGDKEKAMLEQLGHFISTSNRLSGPSDRDESMKTAFGGNNISNLMAKVFCGNSEQPLTVDTSRET